MSAEAYAEALFARRAVSDDALAGRLAELGVAPSDVVVVDRSTPAGEAVLGVPGPRFVLAVVDEEDRIHLVQVLPD